MLNLITAHIATNISHNIKNLYTKSTQVQNFPYGTIADGIAVKRPSSGMYKDFISRYVDGIASVEDDEVAKAIVFLLERTKTVAEGSGAISLAAAALARQNDWDLGEKTCVVLSGGNIDMNIIAKIIQRGMMASGRVGHVEVVATDRPGQLNLLTQLIAKQGANILEVRHDRTSAQLKLRETKIDFLLETKSPDHLYAIIDEVKAQGFRVLG